MTKGDSRTRKANVFNRLTSIFTEYSKIFVVNVDNVGSNQMHQIRAAVRGEAEIAMGKNTMVRRVLRNLIPDHPKLEALLPHVNGNVGFVFTNGDLKDIRDKLVSNTVAAPAKAGVIAPCDVKIPAGSTGMEPGKTSFFQALGIPTKITRGMIEIMNEVHLVKKDTKVSPSEAALLTMMKVMPFTYGMSVVQIYDDGTCFPSSVLDVTDEQLFESFATSLKAVSAISLAIGYPTLAAVPHVMVNAYKNLLSVAVETDFTFPLAEKVKAYLADPSAFAVAAPAAAAADAPAAAAAPVEEEEESDDDMGFGLFD